MGAMASQITGVSIMYSTVCSGADQRRHQSSASLAFLREIHRSPVNAPHKEPVTRKKFPFDDVIMFASEQSGWRTYRQRPVKMSQQCINFQYKDKIVSRPSYLYNREFIPGETVLILRRGPVAWDRIFVLHVTLSYVYECCVGSPCDSILVQRSVTYVLCIAAVVASRSETMHQILGLNLDFTNFI